MVTQVQGEGKEVLLKRGNNSVISSTISETFLGISWKYDL
jgi:hypothetical protein